MSLLTSVELSSSQSKDVLIYPEGCAVSICVLTEKPSKPPVVTSKRPSVCSRTFFFTFLLLHLLLFSACSFDKGLHFSLCLYQFSPCSSSLLYLTSLGICRKGHQIHQSTINPRNGCEELMKEERGSRMNAMLWMSTTGLWKNWGKNRSICKNWRVDWHQQRRPKANNHWNHWLTDGEKQ